MIQRKHLILLSLAGAIISFDQLLKTLVIGRLQPGQSIELISSFFHITLVHNPGAAFGLMANVDPQIREPFFTLVPLITLATILFVYQRLNEKQRMTAYGLSAIVGGAIGNLIDRARIGYVIDFLDFHWREAYHFPAFNIADSAICVGVCLLLISIFFEKQAEVK